MDENLAKSFGLEKARGILVSEVQKDSPADRAGMEQGDVITKLNGIVLENVNELRNRVALLIPKTKAEIEIIRNGKEKTLTVVIGEQPENFSSVSQKPESSGSLEGFGLSFQELTPELADQLV